ncbi:MAG: DUF5615 family PIN-like protein [Acidobacteria bacterium]|nr:DUF5615 family PIN-like protein [Acidobacteriota bacterium]
MAGYLIDANLPYRFSLWASPEHLHAFDLGDDWSDSRLWEYAKANDLILVTKDADFSERVLVSTPPPRVIHVRLGNHTLRELHLALTAVWPEVRRMIRDFKLVQIFEDRLEGIG